MLCVIVRSLNTEIEDTMRCCRRPPIKVASEVVRWILQLPGQFALNQLV